jgi:hypothetical protein
MCNFSCLLCDKFGQSLTPKAQQDSERTAEAVTQLNYPDVIITNTEKKNINPTYTSILCLELYSLQEHK